MFINICCNVFKFVFELLTFPVCIAIWAISYFAGPLPPPPTLSGRREQLVVPPPDFNSCKRLQDLLQKIQHHIFESANTLHCYAGICEDIDCEFQDAPGSNTINFSEDDVKHSFSSNWPRFVPLPPNYMKYKDEMHWGRVEKSLNAPNEIDLNPDLVRAVEEAPSGSNLLVQLKLVLAVAIFHELMHHLTKIRFGTKLTPPGVGGNFVAGEAGLALENKLFGGIIGVVWHTQDVAEPEKILHLVLENHQVYRRLTNDQCQLLLDSIETPRLAKFQNSKLEPHVLQNGTERHRVAEPVPHIASFVLPPGTVIVSRSVGLGIQDMNTTMDNEGRILYSSHCN